MSDNLNKVVRILFPDGVSVIYPETEMDNGYPIAQEICQLINNEKIAELETVAIYLDLPKGTKNGDTRTYVLDRIKELKNE